MTKNGIATYFSNRLLEGENGSVKRDTWTSSFRDVMYALDYPQQVGGPPVVTQPDIIPGAHVQIPDPNLRAVVAEELGKSPNAPITVEEMKGLGRLEAYNTGIHELTGLHFATNLRWLDVRENKISDLLPIASLINLKTLRLDDNAVSDISPVKGLKELTDLEFNRNRVSDLSPVAGLTKLELLAIKQNITFDVSDLLPLTELINLKHLHISWYQPIHHVVRGRTKQFGVHRFWH